MCAERLGELFDVLLWSIITVSLERLELWYREGLQVMVRQEDGADTISRWNDGGGGNAQKMTGHQNYQLIE